MKEKFISTLNYFNLIWALILTASSIYYYEFQRIPFYLFFISYFLEFVVERKWATIQFDKKKLYFSVLALFFLLAFFYHSYSTPEKYFDSLITRRIAILGFAIIGFFGVNNKFKLSYFLNTFIISSILAILFLIFYRIGIVEFLSNPNRSVLFTTERVICINRHMEFNLFLNISLVSIWYILTKSWARTHWLKKTFYITCAFIFTYILIISEGRSGFQTGIILVAIFIFLEIWKRNKKLGIIVALVAPVLLIVAIKHQQRMTDTDIKIEPRIYLWKAALSLIKEKPIFGYGVNEAQVQFDTARVKYQTTQFAEYWKYKVRILHAHNQYLQTTLEFGIVGLLILLFLYTYPIFIADSNRTLLSIFFIIPCAYQSIFDVFITGVNYATIFCVLMLCILSMENNIVERGAIKNK